MTAELSDRGFNTQRGSLVVKVYDYLRQEILSGTRSPGTQLNAARLATELDTSVIPIREALRRLESENLVEIIRNKGARVVRISYEKMIDVYETRKIIEVAALRHATASVSVQYKEQLTKLLHDMNKAYINGDAVLSSDLHRKFHLLVVTPGAPPQLLSIINTLHEASELYIRMTSTSSDSIEDVNREHEEITEAILSERDPAAIADVLERHLDNSIRRLRTIFETHQTDPGSPLR